MLNFVKLCNQNKKFSRLTNGIKAIKLCFWQFIFWQFNNTKLKNKKCFIYNKITIKNVLFLTRGVRECVILTRGARD